MGPGIMQQQEAVTALCWEDRSDLASRATWQSRNSTGHLSAEGLEPGLPD